jgi:ankyrin repeat protein
LAVGVILLGAALMVEGEHVWAWAAGRPTGDHALMLAASMGDAKGARRAIAGGASPNRMDDFNRLPLSIAAGAGDEVMTAVLLGHGALVDAYSGDGCTALTYAAMLSGNVDVVRSLLNAGANVDGTSGHRRSKLPPLIGAVSHCQGAAVELLLKRGADPNIIGAGANKSTPLTSPLMVDGSSELIIQRLIAAGADVNRPDGYGITPLQAALQQGRPEIATILRRAGATG